MNVIVHQYERMDGNRVLGTRLAEHAAIVMAVDVVDEDGATVHPALRDVHGDAREFQAGTSWHAGDRMEALPGSLMPWWVGVPSAEGAIGCRDVPVNCLRPLY